MKQTALAAIRSCPWLVLTLGTAAILTIASAPSHGQEARHGDITRKLQADKDRLSSTEQKAKTLSTDVDKLRDEQARINTELIETGRLTQDSERRMTQIETRLGELDAQEKLIRGSLARRHGEMSRLFGVMQRMGRNPPPVIVTRREDALKMVRSAMLLARAYPGLKAQADELSAKLNDLMRVMASATRERERLAHETTRLNDTRTRLAALKEAKRQSLADRQRELAEVRQVATEISRNVSSLSELIKKLDREVAERTPLGAYENEQSKLASSAPAGTADGTKAAAATGEGKSVASASERTGASAAPGSKPPEQKVALNAPGPGKPSVALLPRGPFTYDPKRLKPAMPFHKAKGRLPWPAHGRLRLSFGDKTPFGSTSRGVVLETRTGATVVSPCDGWVVYSGEFRSYGLVLIINAGDGYHVLLANLARIDVEVGRFVLEGEAIGAMSTNFTARSPNNKPELYVEFRNKAGQSIDPSPWWAEGSQKVQG
ncbi:MAG: murein hydrolase activator EnvC [Hyphomicrobiaceae bacterium]